MTRPCLDCGRLTARIPTNGAGHRCGQCEARRQRARDDRRGTARQRGYDSGHDRTRARLLPMAYGNPCPRCGDLMLPGQPLDLGHTVARSVDPHSRADRIEHALCNRKAGAA